MVALIGRRTEGQFLLGGGYLERPVLRRLPLECFLRPPLEEPSPRGHAGSYSWKRFFQEENPVTRKRSQMMINLDCLFSWKHLVHCKTNTREEKYQGK